MLTQKNVINLLEKYLPENSIEINSALYKYYFLIETENKKYNLTGFSDEKLLLQGIIESIVIFKEIDQKIYLLNNKNILDIGAGAGFPSLPYLIYKNGSFNLTIYEPIKKKCNFLELIKKQLNLTNLTVKNIRAEESLEYEKYNFITARAVSELKNLIQISYHLGKINDSIFCFLKSTNYQNEIDLSQKCINELKLNLKITNLGNFTINNILISYPKTTKTPENYPKKWSQIINGK